MKILDPTMARTANKPKVKISNNRLQIVITWRGVRKYHSLNLPDSARNRQHAEFIANWMQNDILSHSFDPSLKKYKQQDEHSATKVEDISIGLSLRAIEVNLSISTISLTATGIWF